MAAAPWPHARLDAVGSVVTGGTPPTSDRSNYGRQHLFVSPADLGRTKYVRTSAKMLSTKGFAGSRRVPAGSTLFVCIGSTIGKVGLAGEDLATNQQINSIIPNGSVDPEFLFYATSTLSAIVREQAGEQAVPLVNKSQFSEFEIPMPPLVEQKEIATALADADDLIATLERLIAKKQAIKQGMMQQLLTGRTRLPGFTGEWTDSRLGDVLTVRHGRNQRIVEIPSGTVPILATGGQIGWADRPLYSKPSVLIGRKGTIDRPQYQDRPFWTVDTLFYTEISTKADPRFLYYVFQTIDWRSMNEASGVPSLSSTRIESVEVRLPDLAEQKAVRRVLDDADVETTVLRARLAKARAVKQGMMQQLLTGCTRLQVEAVS
ncbi:restriction endonuclease subunit S [Dietzia cinnamea]|uniref:Restriction endonuclease subunit S n=2 Tax=Dietziaceae TaxID=85029 RepID=A0AAW5Q8H4_9ACTN|nr:MULTISPECIES: restriction endonuclease subunit S [Dietzia]MCT1864853.1 restriction endonuclease subunit S [Dietzia cinnamea]MCT2030835.1 restriction endonuclease subunit S [Dietzia cinnamea]MCT2034694.1 restriction endonuclease subunit S [Dietzia cinnamea]MCT2076788.1 restriction endonuclease subunit S [Dietzia cinnamea]MCT2106977.1 restriction endonuclease subunit S [Dietzia cinnamea]